MIERGEQLGIPVHGQDIKITRPGRKYIVVEVTYVVTIDFIGGYRYDWNFSPRAEGPLIF